MVEKGTKVELCASRKKIYQQLLLLDRGMPNANTQFDMHFELPSKSELRKKLELIIGIVQCKIFILLAFYTKGL